MKDSLRLFHIFESICCDHKHRRFFFILFPFQMELCFILTFLSKPCSFPGVGANTTDKDPHFYDPHMIHEGASCPLSRGRTPVFKEMLTI